MNQDDREQRPLEAEAAKRKDWRGDDEAPAEAPGHTSPESESGNAYADDKTGGGVGDTPPTTWAMRPPD